MPSRAAKEAARDELKHDEAERDELKHGADVDEGYGKTYRANNSECSPRGQHGHQRSHHQSRRTRSNAAKMEAEGKLHVEVLSLAGNRMGEFHLGLDPTAGELMDAIASLSDGPPAHKQQLFVGERTFTHPHIRLLSHPSNGFVEQFIQTCRLNSKVASKLRLLAPHLQEEVVKRGEGTSTLVGMRIHDVEEKASAEKALHDRAVQTTTMMRAFGELCEAESASFLHASFAAWRQICRGLPANSSEDHIVATKETVSKQFDLGCPLQVTLLIRHDCWPYLRVRPEGVTCHWCVIYLRIIAADGTDILGASTAEWLSSSEPYDDSGCWGCEQTLPDSSSGSFFHAKSSSRDCSWIQYHMQGGDWPAEIRVKQYQRTDTYATSVVLEGSMDGTNFSFIASSNSPSCCEALTVHDEWTTIKLS